MRKIIGYALLILSCLAWAAMLLIPFSPLEAKVKVAWAGGLFIFAEVAWWLAMPFLGKEIIEKFHGWWQYLKNKFQ